MAGRLEAWKAGRLRACAALFAVSTWLLAPAASAQRVRISPHETHRFTLDGSTIAFNYGRPSKRGREIWGGLVPWGRWWMPGADESTILTTQEALLLGGQLTVPAGQHVLYMLPSPDVSKLIVNTDVGQFHTRYNPSLDVGRVELVLKKLPDAVEQLTFSVDPRPQGGGDLKLAWDDREYSVAVVVRRR